MSITDHIDQESRKNPDELEREIDQKRERIEDLVGALESRLSPGQLFDQALSYTKGHSGEFAHNLGNTLKANPVPAVLTSVGLLWLALGQNRTPAPATTGTPLKDKLSGALDSVANGAGHTRDSLNRGSHDVRDKVTGLSESVSAKASQTGERLSDTAAQAKDTLTDQAQQLKGTFDTLLREQPLVVGALGIALGALLGASLPRTETEDRALGKHSDKLTAKAKQAASSGYEQVKAAGQDVAKEARQANQDNRSQPADAGTPAPKNLGNDPDAGVESMAGSPRAGTGSTLGATQAAAGMNVGRTAANGNAPGAVGDESGMATPPRSF
ncbi:hypothetical protein PPL19_07356 [Pseudomonas psychrotolerans L19]|uniref:DUF3618 domain-containing protein n=1 Tax=Pseudomonas TaxID=286 RepID=UPI00023A12DB|nr:MULTISPECIES: DUF3618 domain-containing protein [Pseudomonas]EHK71481.1 hypothetical protein PPL19_07356 [Pseudomonas psychrotolerans L19]MBA1180480.1 DUF3618 domain-containing protein [Pseudomonas psychrotolerans]MBA1210756.1 DUF3618 domain-containing protein [Pseudomonas psychrotolerans]TCQ87890.1 uncharacterized protein DUF3618 [Pseudomonas sp. JUb52]